MRKLSFLICYFLLPIMLLNCNQKRNFTIKEFPEDFYKIFIDNDSVVNKYKMFLIIGDTSTVENEVYKLARKESLHIDTNLQRFQLVFYKADDDLEYNFGKTKPDNWPGDWFSVYGENLTYEFTWHHGHFLGVNHYIKGNCSLYYDKSKW